MPTEPAQNNDRDQVLADVLAQFAEQEQRGQNPDIERFARDHPELADELRQLLPFARLADSVARPANSDSRSKDENVTKTSLPRQFAGYELQEEIGRGGMGVVYKAWDERLERHVALKMVLRGEFAAEEELRRFRGEAQAAAALNQRNIIPIYDVGEHDGQAYFCMQYIAGETLARIIDKGPLPSRKAARYLAAVSLAVHQAHQQGILHRDLKPSNVLLDDKTDEPLVTDFGLAKRVEGNARLTGTGNLVGTPSYMAPEQATGNAKTTVMSDVYSLGATLYEMLTGRPPFQAASVVDVLLQVRGEEPVQPRLLNAAIDPDLEWICLKCLEKRPEYRYSSALALAEDLQRYLNSEPVHARTSSLTYFFGRLIRETHHAPVMENWGALWMWHSLMIFLLCAVTNLIFGLQLHKSFTQIGLHEHFPYLALWSVGLVVWGALFWNWRRRAGPVSFVERQLAHAWAAGVGASIGAFIVEVLLGLEVLTLTPVLAVMAGMVFIFKAGTLTGWFHVAAGLCFLAAFLMALEPFRPYGPLLFGVVSAVGFFVPGLRYYLRKRRSSANGPTEL